MFEAESFSEPTESIADDFSLVNPNGSVSAAAGEDVILPVHISPETSAVSMNIRWFRGTELIYQYKNRMEFSYNDYENRVSLSIQELKRGNLSLTLKSVQHSDSGDYTCKVILYGSEQTGNVCLQVTGERQLEREMKELEKQIMELEMEKQMTELDGQIKELKLEKRIMEMEKERRIMELEREIKELKLGKQILELERQKKECPLNTHTEHGPTPRRSSSIDDNIPNMSDDGTPKMTKTQEKDWYKGDWSHKNRKHNDKKN